MRFGRRHPALTIASLATIGLFGGLELAAGVLLGAGAVALLRRKRDEVIEPSAEARARMRQILIDRYRAVMHAARGDMGAPATST